MDSFTISPDPVQLEGTVRRTFRNREVLQICRRSDLTLHARCAVYDTAIAAGGYAVLGKGARCALPLHPSSHGSSRVLNPTRAIKRIAVSPLTGLGEFPLHLYRTKFQWGHRAPIKPTLGRWTSLGSYCRMLLTAPIDYRLARNHQRHTVDR